MTSASEVDGPKGVSLDGAAGRSSTQRVLAEPILTRADDLATAGEEAMSRRQGELARLGFEPEGTWRFQSTDPARANQRQQTFVVPFPSPDRTTEALVGVTRVLATHNVARSMGLCTLRSLDANGRVYLTTPSQKLNGFPRNPRNHVVRTRARGMAGLVAAHARHLAAAGATPVALEASEFVARELAVSRSAHEHWLARGLVVREGEQYRSTRRLALRFYLQRTLWPPTQAGDFLLASVAYLALLLASGAGAWAICTFSRHTSTTLWSAYGLFAALAVGAAVIVRVPLAWGHACLPAAIVFHFMGVTAGWPWFAAFAATMAIQPAWRAKRFQKEHALSRPLKGARSTRRNRRLDRLLIVGFARATLSA